MSYRVFMNATGDDGAFACEVQVNFPEFKKDVLRIIKNDKHFVPAVTKALFASRLMKDRARECLNMLENPVYLNIEDRDGRFIYKRTGKYQDFVLVLAIAFAMQVELGRMFLDAVREHVTDACTCPDCVERRSNEQETPEESQAAINELIKDFKKGAN